MQCMNRQCNTVQMHCSAMQHDVGQYYSMQPDANQRNHNPIPFQSQCSVCKNAHPCSGRQA
eukprot:1227889-Pyramimonas_sp.AAC.1